MATAKTYAKTIISEYFLHVKDKGIICKNMGGVAGGQVGNEIEYAFSEYLSLLFLSFASLKEIFMERNIVQDG